MKKLTLNYSLTDKSNFAEKGSFFLFFAAGLLPLLLLILSLSVDFSIYLRNDQKLQEIADQAAILGWRYLPYHEKAKQAATKFINSKGLGPNIVNVGYASARPAAQQYNDEFEVSLKQDLPLTFISYLLPQAKLETLAVSRSRATPRDIMIVFDRSSYMASANLQDNLINQEFSSFIRDHAPFDPFLDPDSKSLVQTAPVIFMTQLCFNPYYSELKKAAINMYEYFAAAGRNGVGMAVFPGIGTENIRLIRPVLRAQQNAIDSEQNSGEALALQISESPLDQDYYIYKGSRLGASSWCAGAAANENSSAIRFPADYNNTDRKKLWSSSVASLPETEIISLRDNQISYNAGYQPALTVREVAWSAVVKNTQANTKSVLDSVFINLLTGPEFESQSKVAIRGGLAGTSTNTAIILAGDVPYFNSQRLQTADDDVALSIKSSFESIRPILATQPELKFKVIYAIINDPSRLSKLTEVRERSQQLELVFSEILNSSEDYKNLNLELIYTENTKTLLEKVLALSLLDNNNKVLAY